MKVRMRNFKELIRIATMNYYINSVQINVDKETNRIWTRMKSTVDNAVAILNMENKTFFELKDDINFNFSTPKEDLKPFLELIEDDTVNMSVQKNKVVINNQLKVYFDEPAVISTLNGDGKLNELEYFVEFELNGDFFTKFKKIKKVASKFGQIYLTVEDGKLYIETTDKMNQYSNGLRFDLCDIDSEDLFLCFPHDAFEDLMEVVYEGFIVRLSVIQENGGLIYLSNEDESERYFLMSEIDL